MLPKPPSTPEWKIQIYRVQDEMSQQRILAALKATGRPGVIALGTQSGPDSFVIVESCLLMNQIWARRLVLTIDPLAVRTFECETAPEELRTRRP